MWITESRRNEHFLYAIPIGFFLTVLAAIGVASGLEFKDMEYGNRWDWLDWTATVLGGLTGQVVQIALIALLKTYLI